jgi:peptidoglycan/xylan/chitin deacetylase (PgdA/CDA1 family)
MDLICNFTSLQSKVATRGFLTLTLLLSVYISCHAEAQTESRNSTLASKTRFITSDISMRPCRCVAFRLDDVSDFTSTSVFMGIMDLFMKKNASLTVGIIGDSFGKDERLVSYIKGRIVDKNSQIEVANHSWKHEHFLNLTRNQQFQSIRKTNEKINGLFGLTPLVFIPPYNEYNDDTLAASEENNIKFFSSQTRFDPRPSAIYSIHKLYHLPQTANTGSCHICEDGPANKRSWHGLSHGKTLSLINKSLSKYGFAIVVVHPWEYSLGHDSWIFDNAIDSEQLKELDLVISQIQKEGLKIVTISNIVNEIRR